MKSDLKMEKKLCSDQNANIDLFLFGHIINAFLYTLCNVYRKIRSYIKSKKLKANPHVI